MSGFHKEAESSVKFGTRSICYIGEALQFLYAAPAASLTRILSKESSFVVLKTESVGSQGSIIWEISIDEESIEQEDSFVPFVDPVSSSFSSGDSRDAAKNFSEI
jgi:hypothetical protein